MDIEKAIELQKEIRTGFRGPSDEVCGFTIAALQELQQYRQIGTVDECRAAREKQIPKEPKRIHKKYGKHTWRRNKSGEIDEFAFEWEDRTFFNGDTYDHDLFCSVCNHKYGSPDYEYCPYCGAKMEEESEE